MLFELSRTETDPVFENAPEPNRTRCDFFKNAFELNSNRLLTNKSELSRVGLKFRKTRRTKLNSKWPLKN